MKKIILYCHSSKRCHVLKYISIRFTGATCRKKKKKREEKKRVVNILLPSEIYQTNTVAGKSKAC